MDYEIEKNLYSQGYNFIAGVDEEDLWQVLSLQHQLF